MQNAPDIQQLQTAVPPEEQVLSPESYVFVALMSVEEGSNKASFIAMTPDDVVVGKGAF